MAGILGQMNAKEILARRRYSCTLKSYTLCFHFKKESQNHVLVKIILRNFDKMLHFAVVSEGAFVNSF